MIGGVSDIVGTCGVCGGVVIAPRVSWAIEAPTPRCDSCDHVPSKSSKRTASTTCARFGYASMGAAA